MVQSKDRTLIPVVLSGGSGTRLWPLSREERPKQFLPLVGEQSLFQQTLLRAHALPAVQHAIVVANQAHGDLVRAQARDVAVDLNTLVLEPAGRNTAPAIAIAALLAQRAASGSDALLLVLPADHVITDESAFAAAVQAAGTAAGAGRLVTFGIVPDKPETGYGYIQRGETHGGWSSIRRFVEKPDPATAERYLRSGDYFWNSGMFLFSVELVLEELAHHSNAVLAAARQAVADAAIHDGSLRLGPAFLASPNISIDYALMEKTANGAVVPLSAGWSDVGSWSALHDVLPRDDRGNVTVGDALVEGCTNTYVSASGRVVAAVGLDNVVIVETDDAVLVVRRDRAQDVKRIVERLKVKGRR